MMRSFAASAEKVVVLQVGWSAYETLLADLTGAAASRLTYDGERLEIMSPSGAHERYNQLLVLLVQTFALEYGVAVDSIGSTTLKMKPRGVEPDAAFYIRNNAAIVGKAEIDIGVDPPPDLVVEIDISRERVDKAELYAALGVPEFWRYDGTRLRAFTLERRSYEEISTSRALPGLSIAALGGFLESWTTGTQFEIRSRWLAWLRSNPPERAPERRS